MISFSKYQATGNDFIVFNSFQINIDFLPQEIKQFCDRHFGIGADGIIIARPSNTADIYMDYYNSDGSKAEMCGNGIRALAAFAKDNNLVTGEEIKVETRAGLKVINVDYSTYQVDMGAPSYDSQEIGFGADEQMWAYPLQINGSKLEVYGVSIGNPHCIIFTKNLDSEPVEQLGPVIENHPLFKNRINVEWVEVESDKKLNVKVWERGVGYTLACGTGACASFAVANRLNLVNNQANISLPGGELEVELAGDSLLLKGEAKLVFQGTID